MPSLQLISANEVEVKEVQWLWYPYIPYGKITRLQDDPGDGKSSFVLALCALLTSGKPLPFQPRGQPPISEICQITEDDAADTVMLRFIRAGGERERLLFISEQGMRLTFGDERIMAVQKSNLAHRANEQRETPGLKAAWYKAHFPRAHARAHSESYAEKTHKGHMFAGHSDQKRL